MGWSLKRALRNPMTFVIGPAAGGFSQLDPGPNGADQPAPGYERRGADQVQWDPMTGMPIGTAGPPAHEVALQYQYRSQELVRRRQNALWGDAQNVLGQGANLLSSYRPGGSAALASGIFGARANVYQNQAANLTEPDLMSAYRENQQILAEREAKRARNLQIGLGVLQAAATIGGAALTGGASLALGGIASAGAQGLGQGIGMSLAGPGQPIQTPGSLPGGSGLDANQIAQQPSLQPAPWAPAGQAPAAPVYGPNPPPGFAPGVTNQPSGGAQFSGIGPMPLGGGTAMSTLGGGAEGAGSGGGKGAPAAGNSGSSYSGNGQPGSGVGQPGGGTFGGVGGYGHDGAFGGAPAGAASVRANPMFEPIILRDIVDDPTYQVSTGLRLSAARRRLLEAMA